MSSPLSKLDYPDVEAAIEALGITMDTAHNLSVKQALVAAGLIDEQYELDKNDLGLLTKTCMSCINRFSVDVFNPLAWWALSAIKGVSSAQHQSELSHIAHQLTQRPWDDKSLELFTHLGLAAGLDAAGDLLDTLGKNAKKSGILHSDQVLSSIRSVFVAGSIVRALFAHYANPSLTDWTSITDDQFVRGVVQYASDGQKTKKTLTHMSLAKYCNSSSLTLVDAAGFGHHHPDADKALYAHVTLCLASNRSDASIPFSEYFQFHQHDLKNAIKTVANLIMDLDGRSPSHLSYRAMDAIYAIEDKAPAKKASKLVEDLFMHLIKHPKFNHGSSLLQVVVQNRPSATTIIKALVNASPSDDVQTALNELIKKGKVEAMEKIYEHIEHNGQQMLLIALQHQLSSSKLLSSELQQAALTLALHNGAPTDRPRAKKM